MVGTQTFTNVYGFIFGKNVGNNLFWMFLIFFLFGLFSSLEEAYELVSVTIFAQIEMGKYLFLCLLA